MSLRDEYSPDTWKVLWAECLITSKICCDLLTPFLDTLKNEQVIAIFLLHPIQQNCYLQIYACIPEGCVLKTVTCIRAPLTLKENKHLPQVFLPLSGLPSACSKGAV